MKVFCLDDGSTYIFEKGITPYEALKRMLYTLNVARNDPNAVINKTESGLHLYLEHFGKTYAVRNC